MTYVYTDFGLTKTGPQFVWLDQRLTTHGFPVTRLVMTLRDRVRAFQLAQPDWNPASADGIVGPKTLARLTADPQPAGIDLTNWKWTGPIPLGGSTPTEIKQPALATYENPPYFDRLGGAILLRAPVNGAHTTNSHYPRSEFRQMDGTALAKWNTIEPHEMMIEQAITVLPAVKRHVVAGQIHDASDDVIEIRLEGPKLFVESRGTEVGLLDINYVLGTRFRLVIRTDSTGIYVYYNGVGGRVLTERFVDCYFKAGCYTQAYAGQVYHEQTVPEDTYGEVAIYALEAA